MDLYWNREICYMDEKEPESKKSREKEQVLFAAQVRAYINEKLKNGTEEETDSPDDMYLSVDGKYFVHHRHQTLPVYPFKNFSNNKNIKGMKKIFILYSNNDVKYAVRRAIR
jgi:hypothetical protein